MEETYKTLISPYKNYCNGFSGLGHKEQGYILGLTNSIGVSKSVLNHTGSTILDQINAFDLAEAKGPYIGQLNMSIVSSFCGPQGLIWGYDIANNLENREHFPNIDIVEYNNEAIPVYSAEFLISALAKLFGTVENKKFIIKPGSHVPFASKNMKTTIPSTIYSAIGIGIAQNRERDACLLMEDFGTIDNVDLESSKNQIVHNLAKSVIRIGQNQNVKYKECLVSIKVSEVKEFETGCALVAAPYFTLAQNAIPKHNHQLSISALKSISLNEWDNIING